MDVAVHDKIRAKMAGGVIITRIKKWQENEANHQSVRWERKPQS